MNISILVRSNLQRVDTNVWKTIRVAKRLAIVIWRLSTRNSYGSVSYVFGVRKSTVIKIFQHGINHIVQLDPTFIKFSITALETAFVNTSF